MNKDTPKTNAEAGYIDGSGCWKYNEDGECVGTDFARRLEREILLLQATIDTHEFTIKLLVRDKESLARREAELREAIQNAIHAANGRQSEWGERAEGCFDFLHAAVA